VAITGVFDMDNFGDLLFPVAAAHRLAAAGLEVTPIAPTATPSRFPDAVTPQGIEALFDEEEPIDGLLIGGGYILHTHRLDILEQYGAGGLGEWAGPALWLGATLAAALRDAPIAWNAPGVPHPLASRSLPLAHAALAAADYASVRDRGAVEFLAPPPGLEPVVVPDPLADLARIWPRHSLDAHFRDLMDRKGAGGDARFVAINLRSRSMAGLAIDDAARLVDGFAAAEGLTPLLVSIGRSHEDDRAARALSDRLTTAHVRLDDPLSLGEIAAALAGSALYLGASLHGYIAAAAYDVPGAMVARPDYRKFSGFLEHVGRPADRVAGWPEAFERGSALLRERPSRLIPETVLQALDVHWDRIAQALSDPAVNVRGRTAFLRAWARAGARTGGAAWASRAFIGRPDSDRSASLRRLADRARDAAE
jgi:hypothetical protein